jgi:hypothetical protein
MNSKFKIQDSRFLVLRRTADYGLVLSAVEGLRTFFETLLFTFLILAADCELRTADVFADIYAPTDSIVLTVGCLDTTFLNIANPDSAWFKWWRDVGGQTIVDSAKVTTALRTGFIRYKVKASDASNNTGTYIAEAVVYKQTKTGIKTWTWAVKNVEKAIADSMRDVWGDSAVFLRRADSSLYMRTDWANVKNPTTYQNLTQTRIHFVDSLGEELSLNSIDSVRKVYFVDSLDQTINASVDTSQIKAMNNNNQWGASYIWSYDTRTLTSGAGSGANSVVIRCKQSSDSSNIAFAQIQVLDSTQNSTIGISRAGSSLFLKPCE